MTETCSRRLVLEPENPRRLANLCGRLNEHLRQIERRLLVKIQNRGGVFMLRGEAQAVAKAASIITSLYEATRSGAPLSPDAIHIVIQEGMNHKGSGQALDAAGAAAEESGQASGETSGEGSGEGSRERSEEGSGGGEQNPMLILRAPKCSIKPRGRNQRDYARAIQRHDINFGIGPAGTGKTYLAVACAVEALVQERISRILLARPAVEAGEKLGFLPGDLAQKVDPYLRPLYDALYEMLGFERVARLIERNVIEVAPLAYMRGRTLNNAFIILDESQNATASQMKMFLTRLGFGSTAVITGDVTQIDLPKGERSGLVHASKVLEKVPGISFTYFHSGDVVRHAIVQKVVDAYEAYDRQNISPLHREQERIHGRDG